MALTLLKRTQIHCAVLINAVGSNTITLATDLLWSSATQGEVAGTGAGAPQVDIMGITWSIPVGNATVSRNTIGTPFWTLTLSNQLLFTGWADNGGFATTNNTLDIVVVIPAGGGTVVLDLVKKGGYGNSQHQNQAL